MLHDDAGQELSVSLLMAVIAAAENISHSIFVNEVRYGGKG